MSVQPPEQSADLRDYYHKHTKTDRLDSKMLARMPMLHPDGLRPIDHLGPVDPFSGPSGTAASAAFGWRPPARRG
ncbi:MAG: hypothetical protein R2761_10165 [Acidimicrobiales bacterium]